MALWSIKRIVCPVPATTGGQIGINVTLIDKETLAEAFEHVEIPPDPPGTFAVVDLLDALDSEYTPNDFGLS